MHILFEITKYKIDNRQLIAKAKETKFYFNCTRKKTKIFNLMIYNDTTLIKSLTIFDLQ